MKKTIALLLAAVMALLLCGTASADDTRTSGLYTYSIKGNGTITITKYNWAGSKGDVYIPSMLDGYTVTGIGESAFALKEAPAGKAVILRLPDTITTIEDFAFMRAGISMVNIPASVKYIGKGAFAACPIVQFTMEQSNKNYAIVDGALYSKAAKSLIAYPFASKNAPVIPGGIQKIEDYACYAYGLQNCVFSARDWPETEKPSAITRSAA